MKAFSFYLEALVAILSRYMPELPEVETIKDELLPWVIGQCFTQVTLWDRKLLRWPSSEGLQQLVGLTVKSLNVGGNTSFSSIEWSVANHASQDDWHIAAESRGDCLLC